MIRVVPLRYGTSFKKAFSDVDVFKGLVKAVLNIDLQIDRVETEKSFYPLVSHLFVEKTVHTPTKNH